MNESDVTIKHALLTGIACGAVLVLFMAALNRWNLTDAQLAIGLVLFVLVTMPAVLRFAIPVPPKSDVKPKDWTDEDIAFLNRSSTRWVTFLIGALVTVILGLKMI